MPRSASLDWFRGVGILAVIWGHAGLPGLPGAYLFIDAFFLVSGFLVSRSFFALLARQGGGARGVLRAVGAFYAGRIRRILIPLSVAVLLTLIAGWLIMLPDDLAALAGSAKATLLLHANLYGAGLGDYFTRVGETAPLLHAWSLSLEEQFYILTPLFLLPALIWRRWVAALLIGVMAALSLAAAQVMSSDPEALGASYYLFQTRVWEFLLGVLLAFAPRTGGPTSARLNDLILTAGLALVFGSVLVITPEAASPGLITLPTLVGVAAVLVLSPRGAVLIRVTSVGALRRAGQMIYSLYLAHYPVIILLSYVGFTVPLALFAVSLIAAICFYVAFERPFGGWQRVGFQSIALVSAGLVLIGLAASMQITRAGGYPARLSAAAEAQYQARFDVNPARGACMEGTLTKHGYSCAFGPMEAPFAALIGDSHSDALMPGFAEGLAAEGLSTRHYWYAGCPALGARLNELGREAEACAKLSYEAHAALLQAAGLRRVYYVINWPHYAGKTGLGDVLAASTRAFAARGVEVVVLGPIPQFDDDPVRRAALVAWRRAKTGEALASTQPAEVLAAERAVMEPLIAPALAAGARFVPLEGVFCEGGLCRSHADGASLYYDDNHLNRAGAARVTAHVFGAP